MRLAPFPTQAVMYTNLAGELGNTHGLPETGPLVDISLEAVGSGVVIMEGYLLDAAVIVTTARFDEVGNPNKAVGIRGGGRGTESITLTGKGFDVLVPDSGCRGSIDVGLGGFVGPGESGSIRVDG